MAGALHLASVGTALRRVCGVAALLGLFAMHGLAVHGALHAGHGTEPVSAAFAIAGHDHFKGTGDAALASTSDESRVGASEERAPEPQLLGSAGLCLAILVVGMVTVAFFSRFIRIPRRPDRTIAQGWPSRSRRDRDPPCLFALSIQRC